MNSAPLLPDLLRQAADSVPDKIALVYNNTRLTYADIDLRSDALANALCVRGVMRGDRVVIYLENSIEAVIAFWAVLKANAVAVFTSPLVLADKLSYILKDSRAAALIACEHLAETFVAAVKTTPNLRVVVVANKVEAVLHNFVREATSFEEALASGAMEPPPQKRNIDVDLAALIYTSNTVGDPKGVMVTHRNMLAATAAVGESLQVQEDDVIFNVLPLAFDYGLYQILLATQAKARLVLDRNFSFPAKALSIIKREGVTVFPGVPTLFAILGEIKTLQPSELANIRCVTSAAAPLGQNHVDVLRRLFTHARIYSMYGLTECKRCSYLPPEDLARKPQSVGIAIPNTELWIVDKNNERVAAGTVGQLVVRGATVMQGYWERPEETQRRLRPGPVPGEQVLYTGDLCRFDDDGYLYFVGRMDDIAKYTNNEGKWDALSHSVI